MKRFLIGALTLVLSCSMAIGQASLLNEATNGLFLNVNDYVIKPNIMFNTVESKQILIGGGYDAMGMQHGANGGALLGYYHPGAIRWSIASSLSLTSKDHKVQEELSDNAGAKEVNYDNPAFESYNGIARFTLGFPNLMNLSAGAVLEFEAATPNAQDIPTGGEDTMDFTIGIPVGMEFTPAIYNYFNPIVHIHQKTTRPGTGTGPTDPKNPQQAPGGSTKKNTSVAVYDKLTIQDLLPAPFGSETAFWIGIGNMELSQIAELEKPAYMIDNDTKGNLNTKFGTQFGMSNLMEQSIGDIKVNMKPMVYFDILAGDHKSATFGATIAAAAGIYAPLGKLPMVLFCGVTPTLQFYTTTYKTQTTEGKVVTTNTAASRALTTNVLWKGKIGTSIILPKDMVLDVTFDVNNNTELSLGLSAQMTIAL